MYVELVLCYLAAGSLCIYASGNRLKGLILNLDSTHSAEPFFHVRVLPIQWRSYSGALAPPSASVAPPSGSQLIT